ncbi:hypothetical protein PR048_031608 [Dryococelus australis]|uniref:Uncharacterized protein n=1 Tax=Dryococelus australis TaxID=614101 RepID=A0ABQ9G5R8_9NEOP|nr:hypothetical protein PR048_031608 [Dryococelus australis]
MWGLIKPMVYAAPLDTKDELFTPETIAHMRRDMLQRCTACWPTWGHGGVVVGLFASHHGEPGSIPGRFTPEFHEWLSCRTMPLVGGFSRESPVSPALSFRRSSILTSITLICLQTSLLRAAQISSLIHSIVGWNQDNQAEGRAYKRARHVRVAVGAIALPQVDSCEFDSFSLPPIYHHREVHFQEKLQPLEFKRERCVIDDKTARQFSALRVEAMRAFMLMFRSPLELPRFQASDVQKLFKQAAALTSSTFSEGRGGKVVKYRASWLRRTALRHAFLTHYYVPTLLQLHLGATVAERLTCSPHTKAIRVQPPAGSLRIFACGNRAGRCRCHRGFLGDLSFPPPLHSGATLYSPQPPSSALQTSMLRAAKISSLRPSSNSIPLALREGRARVLTAFLVKGAVRVVRRVREVFELLTNHVQEIKAVLISCGMANALSRTLDACSVHGSCPTDALMAIAMSQYSLHANSMVSLALGAAMAKRSPPTKAIWVQSRVGSLRIFARGNRAGRCRWSAGFLGDLPFPPPFHSGAAPQSAQSPASALKTSTLRAAQISSLPHFTHALAILNSTRHVPYDQRITSDITKLPRLYLTGTLQRRKKHNGDFYLRRCELDVARVVGGTGEGPMTELATPGRRYGG